MGRNSCPDVGDLPDDYSRLLPKNVPAAERPATSFAGPADVTWYFPIGLARTNPTGVFFPQGGAYAKEFDIILYFHGNKQGHWETINQYWHGNFMKISLREDVIASRKNAVLIAPTMGAAPGAGDVGIFREAGGATCFLDHVTRWLAKYEPHYADKKITPEVRKVVLAGHSGGGDPIIRQMESIKDKVCEIWGFDIVLGSADHWVNFAHMNQTIKISLFHAIQSTSLFNDVVAMKKEKESKLGWNLDNLVLTEAGNDHYAALTNNFANQVKNTPCFAAR